MHTLRKAMLALLLGMGAMLAHAGPNLVLNGDFETAMPGGWNYIGDGYQVGNDLTGSPANHASQVFIDGAFFDLSSLSQTISGLTVGMEYTLSFEIQRWFTPGVAIENQIQVQFGGQEVWNEANVVGDWIVKEFTVLATSTSMLLDFGSFSRSMEWGIQLDNIVLALADDPTVGIPLPGSLALMAGGLPLLLVARRRQRP